MSQENKQTGNIPLPAFGRLYLILGIIGPRFFLITLIIFFAFQVSAQTTPKFYKWNELKYPSYSYSVNSDVFEGYGMQILIFPGMHVQEYKQDLDKGLLGHVWIRPSDEAIKSGEDYVLVIARWSLDNCWSQKDGIFADQIEILQQEFDLRATGNLTTKNLYAYNQLYQYQPHSSYLGFTCKELEGKPGNLFSHGEVGVVCIDEELILIYILNNNGSSSHTLWYFGIQFAKLEGFR